MTKPDTCTHCLGARICRQASAGLALFSCMECQEAAGHENTGEFRLVFVGLQPKVDQRVHFARDTF